MDGSEIFEDSLLLEKVFEKLCGGSSKTEPFHSTEPSNPLSIANSNSQNSPVSAEQKVLLFAILKFRFFVLLNIFRSLCCLLLFITYLF